MIERGNPLSGATQGPRQVEEKRPVLRRSEHVLFMKKLLNMIERGHPLSVVARVVVHAVVGLMLVLSARVIVVVFVVEFP